MVIDIISQLMSCEFAKIYESPLQTLIVKLLIKHNHMDVIRHNDICIDTKVFLFDAKSQTFNDNLYSFRGDENREPICDGECYEIYKNAFLKLVSIHDGIIKRL